MLQASSQLERKQYEVSAEILYVNVGMHGTTAPQHLLTGRRPY